MRDIKFRAYSEINAKMYYNSDYVFETGGAKGYLSVRNKDGELVIGNCTKTMQFTGLKDGHGHDIYEGDILATTDINQVVVGFVEYQDYQFVIHTKDNRVRLFTLGHSNIYQIIGNIYEHPELLEAQ